MTELEKLFKDVQNQLNNESKKYTKLKIYKYSFEVSKVTIISIATKLSFISIFAILSMIFIPIIDSAKHNSNVDYRINITKLKKDLLKELLNYKSTTYISSILPSLLNKGSGVCCKKDNFFEKINIKSIYPISDFKINEILKNNKNYIGTFSKNNLPKLENNQSAIVNLADSNDIGTHWIAMKFVNSKLFYFDSYGIPYIPDIVRKKYPNSEIITNIYRIQSNSSDECGKFCIMFIQSNIKNEPDYIKFLFQFEKNNFENMIYNHI